MSALSMLAKMLGVGEHQAEDALHSERCARVALSRRGFFAAGAALAGGAVFAGKVYAPPPVYVNPWPMSAEMAVLARNMVMMMGAYTMFQGTDR